MGSLFSGIGGFEVAAQWHGAEVVWQSEIEPWAVELLKQHFPNAKQLGDINEIKGSEIEPVDLITFGSPCFPKGTLVLTDKGYIEIENVKVGMRVLTHRGKWQFVTNVGSKQGETVILRGNHYGLECTPNHPIYTIQEEHTCSVQASGKRGRKTILGETEWVPAQDMLTRLWAVPRRIEPLQMNVPQRKSNHQNPMLEMNEDFYYFVGRWLGDGWVRNGQRAGRPEGQYHGTVCVCDGLDKEDELCGVVSKITEHYSVERENTVVKVKFHNQLCCEWLTANFGKGASNKFISPWVYGLEDKYRARLLQGVFDSDGYKVKNQPNQWRVSTVSKKLAEGLRILGEIQGFSTTVYKIVPPNKTIIEGREVNQKSCYTVSFCGNENRVRCHLQTELHSWYRVLSATETGETKTVYNLTVAGDNSYVADGIVVHNCQDMSVAGNRAGLDGARSGLFREAMRIIKEMRKSTDGEYPKYILWENVPGALTSNKGCDFRAVLEEIAETAVPMPESGKWANAGMVRGGDCDIAWRVLDAQYWGVPQRRKRIFLVGDYRSERSAEILFKPEGVSRHTPSSGEARKRIAADIEKCLNETGGTDGVGDKSCFGFSWTAGSKAGNIGWSENISPTLICDKNSQAICMPSVMVQAYRICSCASNSMKSANPHSGIYKTNKASTIDTSGGNPACNQGGLLICMPCVYDARGNGDGATSPTLVGDHEGRVSDYTSLLCEPIYVRASGQSNAETMKNKSPTINNDKDRAIAFIPIYSIDRAAFNQGKNAQYNFSIRDDGLMQTIVARGPNAVAIPDLACFQGQASPSAEISYSNKTSPTIQCTKQADVLHLKENLTYIVRRLTPGECAQLQGFPPDWHEITNENGKPMPDTAAYKGYGNAVATVCAEYPIAGIIEALQEENKNQ